MNNVYSAPAAPPPAPAPVSEPDEAESQGIVAAVKDTAAGLAQAASELVEQIAPSVSTPTPATEAPAPASDPEPTPAASVPEPIPAAPEPAAPAITTEPTVDPVTPSAVLPASEAAAPKQASTVFIHVLPLMPTPVEGAAVARAPVAEANGGAENGPSTHELGAPVKAVEGQGIVSAEKEEAKLTVNGTSEEAVTPAVNGTPEEAVTPAVNGTSEGTKPIPNGTEESKPAVNGTTHEAKPTPTLNGTPTKEPATNGASPTTPVPVPASPSPSSIRSKKMRFPSLSARHSRRSSASATELGEAPGSPGQSREKLDTHASRAAAGETVRRKRTSIFGKIKGIFDSPQANGHAKTNGA